MNPFLSMASMAQMPKLGKMPMAGSMAQMPKLGMMDRVKNMDQMPMAGSMAQMPKLGKMPKLGMMDRFKNMADGMQGLLGEEQQQPQGALPMAPVQQIQVNPLDPRYDFNRFRFNFGGQQGIFN